MRPPAAPIALAVALAASAIAGCTRHERSPAHDLRSVRPPDTSNMSEAVRTQIRGRYSALTSKLGMSSTPPGELASAYGDLGELLLAAHYLDSAEPALRNARILAPGDARWPYDLGHLYRMRGSLAQAAAAFREVLALKADDVPARIWLASSYIDQGQYDDAEPLLASVIRLDPESTAALYHAGRLSLARHDFPHAATQFEAALRADPGAAAIHYPLAMAYRGLGREADAEAQLRLRDRRNAEIAPTDPLMDRLAALLEGPQAYEVRGTEALKRGDWKGAADDFRKATALAPGNAMLRHRWATALFMMGNAAEAERQFAEAVRESPEYAPAHYSLAVLLESRGQDAEAIERYTAAVKYQPTYVQARMRLAGLLRRSGRPQEALSQYASVADVDPAVDEAQLQMAITLVRVRRYAEARDRLIAGMRAYPQQRGFARALARLLAAAPDDAVRDGRRALALTEQLLKDDQSTDIGETMAMALAASGNYAEAVRIQRELIAVVRSGKRSDLVPHMVENLKLYDSRMPCRTPWRDEDVGDTATAPPDAMRAALALK